jgi:hypothetical protein
MTVIGPACQFCNRKEDVRFQIRTTQKRETMWVVGPDGEPMAMLDPGVYWCCATCVDCWRRKDARTFAEILMAIMIEHVEGELDIEIDAVERLRILNDAEREYKSYMQGAVIMELK